jgi:RNA-splicing ligase RtcB
VSVELVAHELLGAAAMHVAEGVLAAEYIVRGAHDIGVGVQMTAVGIGEIELDHQLREQYAKEQSELLERQAFEMAQMDQKIAGGASQEEREGLKVRHDAEMISLQERQSQEHDAAIKQYENEHQNVFDREQWLG